MHIRFCFARCALGQVFTMLQTQAGDVRHVGLAAQGFKHCVWDSAGGWGGKWVVLPCYFYVYCIVFFLCPIVVPPFMFICQSQNQNVMLRLICPCHITCNIDYG